MVYDVLNTDPAIPSTTPKILIDESASPPTSASQLAYGVEVSGNALGYHEAQSP
jgi:hypothetical protein